MLHRCVWMIAWERPYTELSLPCMSVCHSCHRCSDVRCQKCSTDVCEWSPENVLTLSCPCPACLSVTVVTDVVMYVVRNAPEMCVNDRLRTSLHWAVLALHVCLWHLQASSSVPFRIRSATRALKTNRVSSTKRIASDVLIVVSRSALASAWNSKVVYYYYYLYSYFLLFVHSTGRALFVFVHLLQKLTSLMKLLDGLEVHKYFSP